MSDRNQNVHWPDWTVGEPIGRGSFGTVYRMTQDVYGYVDEAALKVMTIPHDESEIDYLLCAGVNKEDITNTFKSKVGEIAREYQLMRKLGDNPNIVHCDGFRSIQHDDGLGWDIYIKMELLTPLLKAPRVLLDSEEKVVKFACDMCDALTACQRLDIIHRDIKPQNVFVSKNGCFKLGDFGIARTMERTTNATAGIGTYSYMAPEVARNEAYGRTADIYSLGLMLYWLLNERRGPFLPPPPAVPKAVDTEKAWTRRIGGEAFPAPKNGSDKLKTIVMKACAFDPKDRYQSAEEMKDALCAGAAAALPPVEEDPVDRTVYSPNNIIPEAPKDHQKISGAEDIGTPSAVPVEIVKAIETDDDRTQYGDGRKSGKNNQIEQEKDRRQKETPDLLRSALQENHRTKNGIPQNGRAHETSKGKRKSTKLIAVFASAVLLVLGLIVIGLSVSNKDTGDKMQDRPDDEAHLQGWVTEDDDRYYYRNGEKITGLQKIGSCYYYFNHYGIMGTDWQEIAGEMYYFDANGIMCTGLTQIDDQLYYFGTDGRIQYGWRKIAGEQYYFSDTGVAVTGWHEINGKVYYFSESGVMLEVYE